MSKQVDNADDISGTNTGEQKQQVQKKQGNNGKTVKRRGVLARIGAVVVGAGAAVYLGLRGAGAAVENTVDARADAAFNALAKPLEFSADVVLTDSVNALETARPFVQQFLNAVQTVQNIGTKDINAILAELEKIPFLHTTDLQKFTTTVNMLLEMKENDLLTLLDLLEKSSNNLKQQIVEAEHKGPAAIHGVVRDGVRSIDPVAP